MANPAHCTLLTWIWALAVAASACTPTDSSESTQPTPEGHFYYAERQDWRPSQSNSLNISHFVYRDRNRNGKYDTVDRPMVGVGVKLTRPDGTHTVNLSNLHGFVNFTTSPTEWPVDISEPGPYSFEVLVPDGWFLTSGNGFQQAQFSLSPNTRPGMIVSEIPEPAGLARILDIQGTVLYQDGNRYPIPLQGTPVWGQDPAGRRITVRTDSSGAFSIPATPGEWIIGVPAVDEEAAFTRAVRIGEAPVRLSKTTLGSHTEAPFPYKILVDFESVTTSPITKMPNGFFCLNWKNLIPVEREMYGGMGYVNGTTSGRYVAYNTSGYPVVVKAEGQFDFFGGHFGVAWMNAEGETLRIRAWRDTEMVREDEIRLSSLGPVWFEADYRGITKLELSTLHYWQFVLDDARFGLPAACHHP